MKIAPACAAQHFRETLIEVLARITEYGDVPEALGISDLIEQSLGKNVLHGAEGPSCAVECKVCGGRGPCGACAWCCKQERERAEQAEARALDLEREARQTPEAWRARCEEAEAHVLSVVADRDAARAEAREQEEAKEAAYQRLYREKERADPKKVQILLRARLDAALYLVRQAREAMIGAWETPIHRSGWLSRATTLLEDKLRDEGCLDCGAFTEDASMKPLEHEGDCPSAKRVQ